MNQELCLAARSPCCNAVVGISVQDAGLTLNETIEEWLEEGLYVLPMRLAEAVKLIWKDRCIECRGDE